MTSHDGYRSKNVIPNRWGEIKWLDKKLRYGFIISDTCISQLYFHLDRNPHAVRCETGDRVSFYHNSDDRYGKWSFATNVYPAHQIGPPTMAIASSSSHGGPPTEYSMAHMTMASSSSHADIRFAEAPDTLSIASTMPMPVRGDASWKRPPNVAAQNMDRSC